MSRDNGKETFTSAPGKAESVGATRGSDEFRYAGRNPGTQEQEPAHNEDRIRRNRLGRLAGGILSQLIEDYEDQLAESVKRTEKLQSKLERLKQLQLLQSKD